MLDKFHNAFIKTAQLIFSLPPIMIGMLGMYIYLVYESQALLYELMPDIMGASSKSVASLALSIAIHLTILTTSANSRLVSGWFPVIFAFYAYGITATFFDAYDFNKTTKQIYEANLFSSLIAIINYLFTYLFVRKYQKFIGDKPLSELIVELKKEVSNLKGKATKLENELTIAVSERNEIRIQHEQKLVALRNLSQKHEELITAAKESRACLDCEIIKKNLYALNRYKASCEQCQLKKKTLTKDAQSSNKSTRTRKKEKEVASKT